MNRVKVIRNPLGEFTGLIGSDLYKAIFLAVERIEKHKTLGSIIAADKKPALYHRETRDRPRFLGGGIDILVALNKLVGQVIRIHEAVIQPNELQGIAHNKSIEAVLGRIEHRLAYGLIGDALDLAASYACYIAVGRCFHDANKRTAHTSMQLVLALNGISIEYDVAQMDDKIIAAAQGLIEEDELANYLGELRRYKCREAN